MNEDGDSKLQKERAESIGGAADEIKLDGIWALGRGNKEGGSIVLTRLTTCPRTGVGGFFYRALGALERFTARFGREMATLSNDRLMRQRHPAHVTMTAT